MNININTRNDFVDIVRGIAMLLVVLGHTITGCSVGSQDSFLYNVIWSLQMPLFVLISGYVTRYSRGCYDGKSLKQYVYRRTLAYLLPWAVWTFLIRGLICGNNYFLNPSWVCYNMDSGYWFLVTIWTISICFGLSEFFAKKLFHSINKEIMATSFLLGLFGIVLLAIGMLAGMNFSGIKLTLYYIPFYWIGYLYGKLGDDLDSTKMGNTIKTAVVAISTVVWVYFMYNFNLFNLPDSGSSIVLRIISSIIGCITVCGLCKGLFCAVDGIGNQRVLKWGGVFRWSGVHSLEIYLGQYLMLNIIRLEETPLFSTVNGLALSFANFILTMTLLVVVILLTNQNKYLRLFLYGKTK